ncbi:hypothetical protein FVR03_19890 [Pontibacter qinzhouensis]|uniref:Uncharacterized protein n=1 Tax=Pontibacter qinzhouensis TaxID=2603253 RepID=A0A5C8J4J8_9BACT|nr:hypothetical protein [Pontibacter qinzhouensis]TXK31147.1 hypothetical protein FVR03_19890 [Pontibacter qinzhouensis]
MNFFDLKTGYALAAFPDFEAAFAATEVYSEKGFKIVYLNEVSHMGEQEVMEFVLKYKSQHKYYFHNYTIGKSNDLKLKATESLQTALQVLAGINQQEPKFLMILTPKKVLKTREEQVKAIKQLLSVDQPARTRA